MSEKINVMVCVTQQKTCERLIKAGTEIQDQYKGKIYVVHVSPVGWNILGNSKEGEALDYLFEISKNAGAEMSVLKSTDVVQTIYDYCMNNNAKVIVLGESLAMSEDKNIILKLKKKLRDLVILKIISTD